MGDRPGSVAFDRAAEYYDLTRGLFLDSGIVPATVMELDNIEAAKKMVEQGMGVALLPRVAVAREVALGTLATVAIADAPTIRRPVVAIHRRGPGLSGPGLVAGQIDTGAGFAFDRPRLPVVVWTASSSS